MKFQPGDKIVYRLTKREYIVERCYWQKVDDIRFNAIDVKPVDKRPGDKYRFFKGYNSEFFDLVENEPESNRRTRKGKDSSVSS